MTFQVSGTCPICEQDVEFVSHNDWLRDNFLCQNCKSIPRERALMQVIRWLYPQYARLVIHESSPAPRGVSAILKEECAAYIPSQYYLYAVPGTQMGEFRCENLENLTFADESIDLHITQDVFEHVFDAKKAFREIARTLKHGGAHIFTVPLVNGRNPTTVRASIKDGQIIHHLEPVMHGNPIDEEGSLVVRDWGYDIVDFIYESTGMSTDIIKLDNIYKGLRAEYLEVLVTKKA